MTDQVPAEQVPDTSLGQIAQQLDGLIQAFERHPIVQVREQVMEMLSLIDILHRQGLQHLVEVLRSQEPVLFKQVQEDKEVHILLTLYDLLPEEPREQVAASAPARPGRFIPLTQVRPAARTIKRPVFTPVASIDSIATGALKGVEVEGVRFLLCNLDGTIYAYRNACAGSILPLDRAKLNGNTLLCPWHNCLYDMRTGKRLDGGTGRLEVIPVAIRDGMIQLALTTESVSLPVTSVSEKSGKRRTSS